MKKNSIPNMPVPFIWHITKPHKWILFSIIFFIMLDEIFFALGPFILGRIIDSANIFASEGVGTLSAIGFLVILYIFLRLLGSLSIRVTAFALHYLSKYVRTSAYKILFEYLALHSNTYFGNRFAGAISSDINIVGQNTVRMIRFFSRSFLSLLFTTIMTFILIATANFILAILFILGAALLIPLNYFLAKPTASLAREAVKTLSTLRGQIVDAITNIIAVQQFTQNKNELDRIDVSIKNYQEASIKADFYSEKVVLLNNVIVILLFVGGLIYGSFVLWAKDIITLGEFIMIATLSVALVRSLSYIGSTINEFASMYGETKHTLGQILKKHDIVDISNAKELEVNNGEIKIQKISFNYHETLEIFKDFTLHIKPGEKVGLVGPSGGGKTTLIKLLLRQYEVTEGTIVIDNQDIKKITQDSLRRSIGVVPQEPALFHRSLFENIAYGKSNATIEEVEIAAKKAHIHDFIVSLKKGYETLTGERGIKLSGGQRQRIAIARTILKAAPILILDEATSALDSESEAAIQKGLHELMQSKTVIAIAHRLSTIKEMDRIIVLENGKVVQDGSHTELLKNVEETYARLWYHQAGGFIKDHNE